ncbi:unnamed protein product [Moneuplotes crassus]|uniref:Uncharacterized protein n=1 Tax=Euplotes crassus TaxID=5936 RepID=A0AAD1U7E4_EUPCR|nr:unnamed protein product [Moneuplotes crassus]
MRTKRWKMTLKWFLSKIKSENVDSKENKRAIPHVFSYNIHVQKYRSPKNSDYYNTGTNFKPICNENNLKNPKKDFNPAQDSKQAKIVCNTHTNNPSDMESQPEFNNFQKFDDLNLQLHDNSAELEEDFRNLERLESSQHDRTNSLNLGSVYSKNEYQFDDKVSSVQRDLSIYNYSEEFDADDLSSSENNDKITQLGQYQQNGLMRDRTYGKLSQPCSSRGMLRIKSSTKLFTLDNPKNETSQNSSDSFSNLSTGDSAYPVESFKQRAIKEFRPKISICNMNRECLEPKNTPFEVPRTKRTYEPPIGSKVVYSPPNQEVNKNMNIYKRVRPKPTTYHQSKNSAISDCSENITADEGFAITFPEKVTVQKSRINYMPVNKPFNRKEYTQPQSMLTPANRYSYLHIRRNRPGFCSRIS